jgi:hypothetical protein
MCKTEPKVNISKSDATPEVILARMLERELSLLYVDAGRLSVFIQNYWSRVAPLAHAIHGEHDDVDTRPGAIMWVSDKGIGWAVKQLQAGGKVRRKLWYGPLHLEGHDGFIYTKSPEQPLALYSATQPDLLATDWELA